MTATVIVNTLLCLLAVSIYGNVLLWDRIKRQIKKHHTLRMGIIKVSAQITAKICKRPLDKNIGKRGCLKRFSQLLAASDKEID